MASPLPARTSREAEASRASKIARIWHAITFGVVAFALIIQVILVIDGVSVLTTANPPGLAARLARFVGYFTVQSNVLAALVSLSLARRPDRDGPGWRVARVDSVIGMTVTGLVAWFLLRPLMDLHGWAALTDTLLHVVGPLLVLFGWLIFGPRPRVSLRVLLLALIWPAVWLLVIMLQAQASGWYPYPFLDLRQHGAGQVVLTCLGVTLLFLVLDAVVWLVDRRLPTLRAR